MIHDLWPISRIQQLALLVLVLAFIAWGYFSEILVQRHIRAVYANAGPPGIVQTWHENGLSEEDAALRGKMRTRMVSCVVLFGIVSIFLLQPAFTKRFVGKASAESLGAIRIVASFTLLLSTLWEDLASSALLPREMVHPMGFWSYLYDMPIGFGAFVSNGTALWVFQMATTVLLLLAMIGWRSRVTVPLATLAYFVLGGIFRHYTWFYHTGLVPLYVLMVLSFTPCGHGLSVDRWKLARRVTPAPVPSFDYGWYRYACWLAIAFPYVAAGLSKLRNGGPIWWKADHVRQSLFRDCLTIMEFDFDFGLKLLPLPDFVFSLLGFAVVASELLYGTVLISRRARLVIPMLTGSVHLGIWFLHNILFLDLILIQLVFYDFRGCLAWLHRNLRWPEPKGSRSTAEPSEFHWPALGISALASTLVYAWLSLVEFYPLTAMQMYSRHRPDEGVIYDKVLVTQRDGTIRRFRIRDVIGALADGRSKRAVDFSTGERQVIICQKLLRACAHQYNQTAEYGQQATHLQVQRWEWNFRSQPKYPNFGEIKQRLVYNVATDKVTIFGSNGQPAISGVTIGR